MIAGATDSVDLTPGEMIPLSGFANRADRAEGVADRIEANAIALRDATGRTAVIVAFDALFVGPVMDAALRRLLVEEFGVADSDILLLASHSHFTPSLDPGKPKLGAVDPAYLEWAVERSLAMLRRLLGSPFLPLTLAAAEKDWDGSVHRRRRWPLPYLGSDQGRFGWHEPAMAPDEHGPRDPLVRVWRVANDDGEPLAILWNCACHPTGFPSRYQVSAEFPGHVRAAIRARHGASLPVLFLQGFAGDIRQRTPDTRPALKKLALALRFGPSFCAFDEPGWRRWAETLSEVVIGAIDAARDAAPIAGRIDSAATDIPLSALVEGDNREREVRFQRLSIGDRFELWALAAEPSVELKAYLPPCAVPLGYLGDVFGYWPTDRQAAEGGYEGRGFLPMFELRGRLRSGTNAIFKDAVQRLKAAKS